MGGGEIHITDARTRAKLLAGAISRWDVARRLTDEAAAVRRMGLSMRVWRRAVCARPVGADPHLAICDEIGIDPVRCAEPRPRERYAGPIQWAVLGAAVRLARELKHHGVREAGAAAGVSCATVSRCENGMVLSFEGFARLSAYAGQHPHAFTHGASAPARSTGNTDCNALNKQGVSHA